MTKSEKFLRIHRKNVRIETRERREEEGEEESEQDTSGSNS